MARYAADGAAVTLLTCTLGELGEILVPELAGVAAERADQLGGYRITELREAMRALGITDHRFLGGAGRWRDSGMIGTAGNDDPRSFWQCASDEAAFGEAVEQVVDVIREVRPQVLITYDRDGGYGHPDHIMAHRVAMAASHRAAHPGGPREPWQIEKIYWGAGPATPEHDVTTVIDGSSQLDAKRRAMQAHATQIIVDRDFFALSNLIRVPLSGVERYRLVRGDRAGVLDDAGRETDLFAGVPA